MPEQPSVVQLIEAGLRATGLQGRAVANNIANLNTPGYRRYAVEFEKVLAEAIDSGELDRLSGLELPVVQPRNTPVGQTGNDVNLETEIGEMLKNGALYKTYVRLMAKAYRQMELAMEVT